jgi:hypothetical protein
MVKEMNILKILALSGYLLILAVAFAAEAGTYTKVLGNHTVTFSTSDQPSFYGPDPSTFAVNGITVHQYILGMGKLVPGFDTESMVGVANYHTSPNTLNAMLNNSLLYLGVPAYDITRKVPYFIDGKPAACGYGYSPEYKDIVFFASYESKPGTIGLLGSIGNETRFVELAKSYRILT